MDSFTKSRIYRLETDTRALFKAIEELKEENNRRKNSIDKLVEIGADFNNRITALEECPWPTKDEDDETSFADRVLAQKPIEHQVVWKMLSRCSDWFYRKAKEDLGSEGYDTDVESYGNFVDTVRKTGFISINIENERVFLYAANPMAFIEFNDMWDDVQAFISGEFGLTLAIGRFIYLPKCEDPTDFGEDMTSTVNEFIDGLRKPGQD